MNVDLYERIWMWGVGVMLALFFGSTAAAAFGQPDTPAKPRRDDRPGKRPGRSTFSSQGVSVDARGASAPRSSA